MGACSSKKKHDPKANLEKNRSRARYQEKQEDENQRIMYMDAFIKIKYQRFHFFRPGQQAPKQLKLDSESKQLKDL